MAIVSNYWLFIDLFIHSYGFKHQFHKEETIFLGKNYTWKREKSSLHIQNECSVQRVQ